MDKTKRWIKNNLIFFLSLVAVGLAVLFVVSILQIDAFSDDVSATRVGHIRLGEDEDAYASVLNTEIADFLDECTYTLSYQNQDLTLDAAHFHFQTDKTLAGLNKGEDNPAVFVIADEGSLTDDIRLVYGPNVTQAIDHASLRSDILAALADLRHVVRFDLQSYMLEEHTDTLLGSALITGVDDDLTQELSSAESITIPARSLFSWLDATEDTGLSNEALGLMATLLMEVAVDGHFTDMIFDHDPSDPPGWADGDPHVPIMRANGFDFTMFNPFRQTYTFTVETQGESQVLATLTGSPYVNAYTSRETVVSSIPYPTEYVADDSLNESTPGVITSETDTETIYRVLLQDGENGWVNGIVRTVTTPSGASTDHVVLTFIDPPNPQIYAENIVPKAGE